MAIQLPKQIGNAISRVYTRYLPGIYLNDSEYMYLVYTRYIPCIYLGADVGIYLVYTRYIPGLETTRYIPGTSANSGAIICYYSILVPIIRIITYYFILFFLLFQLFHLHISDYYFLLSQTLDLGYYFYYFNSIISIIFIGIYYTHYCH